MSEAPSAASEAIDPLANASLHEVDGQSPEGETKLGIKNNNKLEEEEDDNDDGRCDLDEKHQLEQSEFDAKSDASPPGPVPQLSELETDTPRRLSPRQGVSFREEYDRLPDFENPQRTPLPQPPVGYRISAAGVGSPLLTLIGGPEERQQTAPFVNVSLSEFVGQDVPLLVGELPVTESDHASFWATVNRLNVCGIVTVNLLRDSDKDRDDMRPSSPLSVLPWPNKLDVEVVYARKICARALQIEEFRSFQSHLVKVQDLDFGIEREVATWSFTTWPPRGNPAVPRLPHFFLDFLRAVIQQTYFSCRSGQPLLIVDRNGLDVAGLAAAVVMLLYQACEQRRADVWRCVAELRTACHKNVVSKFAMYEFLYDCLLQVMCATPTIMSGDFRRAFRHLLRRGPTLVRSPRSMGSDSNRRIAPILEQFELVCSLASMYRSRVIPNRSFSPGSPKPGTKRSLFEPREHKGIAYFRLPSFVHSKHFLAVRGVIHVNQLLELMAKRYSRTLLWFSETPRPDEILTGNQHDGVVIGEVSACGVFYSYEMEAPTARGPWRITVIQFVGWPAFSGERPARPCRELIVTLRRVLEHADAVAASFTPSLGPLDPPLKPVVTLYEADAGCCTWRSAMAAIAASLDQRMNRFSEVDIFRTCQVFKIFDPDSIVISVKQYTWCFKMAWSSFLLSNEKSPQAEPATAAEEPRYATPGSTTFASEKAKPADDVDLYGSEKYLYAYPTLELTRADSEEMMAEEVLELPSDRLPFSKEHFNVSDYSTTEMTDSKINGRRRRSRRT